MDVADVADDDGDEPDLSNFDHEEEVGTNEDVPG
jgi:hypothetical protein